MRRRIVTCGQGGKLHPVGAGTGGRNRVGTGSIGQVGALRRAGTIIDSDGYTSHTTIGTRVGNRGAIFGTVAIKILEDGAANGTSSLSH